MMPTPRAPPASTSAVAPSVTHSGPSALGITIVAITTASSPAPTVSVRNGVIRRASHETMPEHDEVQRQHPPDRDSFSVPR
jgi:hypothetical protein